jgi:hypothetical protein
VAAGARRIDLALAAEASGAVVAVAGTPMRHRATCEQTPSAFLSGLAGRTGGTLALDDEPERRRYAITLSCAA